LRIYIAFHTQLSLLTIPFLPLPPLFYIFQTSLSVLRSHQQLQTLITSEERSLCERDKLIIHQITGMVWFGYTNVSGFNLRERERERKLMRCDQKLRLGNPPGHSLSYLFEGPSPHFSIKSIRLSIHPSPPSLSYRNFTPQ
jgi:hypothetical protein